MAMARRCESTRAPASHGPRALRAARWLRDGPWMAGVSLQLYMYGCTCRSMHSAIEAYVWGMYGGVFLLQGGEFQRPWKRCSMVANPPLEVRIAMGAAPAPIYVSRGNFHLVTRYLNFYLGGGAFMYGYAYYTIANAGLTTRRGAPRARRMHAAPLSARSGSISRSREPKGIFGAHRACERTSG
eukprot:COSAG05_NODE_1835_length_3992_cov_2.405343_4_plen_184_part_00